MFLPLPPVHGVLALRPVLHLCFAMPIPFHQPIRQTPGPPGFSPRGRSRLASCNCKRSPHIHNSRTSFIDKEGPDVGDRFYPVLRQINDFLQVLTLGISVEEPEDKEITTASYRQLPADRISLLEGGATLEEPLRVKLPALYLQTYSAWGLRDDEKESFLFRKDIADSFSVSVNSRFAGPACIRAVEVIPRTTLRPFWPMAWVTKRFCDEDFRWNRAWHVWLKDIHGNSLTFQSLHGTSYRVRLQQHDLVAHQTAPQLGQPAKWSAEFVRCWQITDHTSFEYAEEPAFYLTLEYHLETPFHPVARAENR
ncbi:hypothetical protein RHOSPDRAFT_27079 [Rhodotorula sp. JG-1b]|nr:hypothetical protein RHOSPDRAFT_27079 [Rhodotorula sp. JG-1b]